MMKSQFVAVRVDPVLKSKITTAAEQHGMNDSEFIRYTLHLFFDQTVDSKPQANVRHTPAPADQN